MRKLVALSALLGASLSLPSLAADLAVDVHAPGYSWSGLYVGVHGALDLYGTRFGDADGEVLGEDGSSVYASSLLLGGGASLGFDQQFGNGVVGIVGDLTALTGERALITGPNYHNVEQEQYNSQANWLATIRAKAGVNFDNVLIYGTGGAALLNRSYEIFENADYEDPCDTTDRSIPDIYDYSGPYSANNICATETSLGFAVGAGIDVGVTETMAFTFNYLYVGIPTTSQLVEALDAEEYSPTTYERTDDLHTVHAGVKMMF